MWSFRFAILFSEPRMWSFRFAIFYGLLPFFVSLSFLHPCLLNNLIPPIGVCQSSMSRQHIQFHLPKLGNSIFTTIITLGGVYFLSHPSNCSLVDKYNTRAMVASLVSHGQWDTKEPWAMVASLTIFITMSNGFFLCIPEGTFCILTWL